MGGGMGEDNRVLEVAALRLKPGGRLVLHLVLMGSLTRARDYLINLKWPFTVTQVAVSRSREPCGGPTVGGIEPGVHCDRGQKIESQKGRKYG